MSKVNKDATFSLKVVVNKETSKVLFADVDSSFADVVLSFLTLPLGTIVRILNKHYEDDAPTFGSVTTLYNSLANLDNLHFWTEGAKSILLFPRTSLDPQRRGLKLDISDSPLIEYFVPGTTYWNKSTGFQSLSMYYDTRMANNYGTQSMKLFKFAETAPYDDDHGVFTTTASSFVITDDLRIVPASSGLLQIASFLGITDFDKAEQINVTFGYDEVMALLKATLISSTPLSDVVFRKTGPMKSTKIELQRWTVSENGSNSNSKKMSLRAFVHKSTNKFLYVQAEADFVELLFSFLIIPLGGVERLLASRSCNKSMDLLYMSAACVDRKYFKTKDAINMLIKPKIPHGYVPDNHILPLAVEDLPESYKSRLNLFSSVKFPEGQGKYLKTPATFMVTDDLTVTPLCLASALFYLKGMNIPISDVREVEVEIGLNEALGILRASLTSASALSDGLNLPNNISRKRQKQG